MTEKKNISAKITQPSLAGEVSRERLFRLLDQKLEKPVVWISARAGAGKTTLVSSYLGARQIPCIWYQCDEEDADLATFFYYMGKAAKTAAPCRRKPLPLLTPEYLGGISVFIRRYFEELYSRLAGVLASGRDGHHFMIVLDNYQDIPAGSPFHDMMTIALSSIPAGIRFAVISRTDPPPALSRLLANDAIRLVGYDTIRFSFSESRKFMRSRNARFSMESARAIYEKSEGWASGLILLLEQARLKVGAGNPADRTDEKIFDYFAAEIFARADESVQDFLLKTSFLPVLNISICRELAGIADSGRILSGLNRSHFFTDRLAGSELEYRYHALFRAFLQSRAKHSLDAHALAAVQRTAAHLLERAGLTEDAAHLYRDAGDMPNLCRIITEYAHSFLLQGRARTIAEWIAAIPPELAEANPWIQYWAGLCCFPVDMARTRRYLEKAFASFRSGGDIAGIYLSWAGIVDTYSLGLDEWKPLDDCITLFESLRNSYPVFPSKEIDLVASSRMLTALTLRKTDRPQRVHQWLKRVVGLLQDNPSFDIQMDTIFSMSVYYLWKGEYEKNAVLLEQAEAEIRLRKPPPFAVIRIKLMKGIQYWLAAQYDAALKTLSEGLVVSAKSGVHVFDSLLWCFKATAEMGPGNLAPAQAAISHQVASATGKTLDTFFCHINSAWYELLSDQPARAAEYLNGIAYTVAKMGNPYYKALWNIGMAESAFLQGQFREARAYIRTAHQTGLTMKSHVVEWFSLLIEAWFFLQEGRKKKGLDYLRRALEIGNKHRYVHLEFYLPKVMRCLCAEALEAGIEREYVKWLIRKLDLTPPADSGCHSEAWPWSIRIYTLGRFNVVRDDKSLEFPVKEQKKPLELLKALVAYGGDGVPVDRLADALWPDADGDLARKAFETTLARLRKLLGSDDYVKCRAGQVTLDPHRCWTDSVTLERLFDAFREAGGAHAAAIAEKAVSLYKGAFLPSDSGRHWVAAQREQLKNRLLRVIAKAGRQYEQAGQWETAAELYVKGLDTDYLAEDIYKRLMICYRNLGNHADAVKTYNRCRSLLKAELGIEPSAETRAIYTSLLQES